MKEKNIWKKYYVYIFAVFYKVKKCNFFNITFTTYNLKKNICVGGFKMWMAINDKLVEFKALSNFLHLFASFLYFPFYSYLKKNNNYHYCKSWKSNTEKKPMFKTCTKNEANRLKLTTITK